MKRILIFSDTHGYTDPCIEIIRKEPRIDAVIHAGDCTRDAEDLKYIFPDLPVYYVKGNNDFLSDAPSEMTFSVDGVKIFVTHGHEQRVKYELAYHTLRAYASKLSPNLVIFGHTHIPYTAYDDNMVTLNPGSIKDSKTYAVAEIEKGSLKTRIFDI